MWPFNSTASSTSNSSHQDLVQQSCPIDHTSQNGAERFDRRRADDQQSHGSIQSSGLPSAPPLSTDREVSSIPRYKPEPTQIHPSQSSVKTMTTIDPPPAMACPMDPMTQTEDPRTGNWVYPSPSQFYDALKRKNHHPTSSDMYTVVPIHNAVNERVWTQVLEWEANYGRGSFDRWPRSGKSGPMLCSFRGRPNDLSPRAWIKVLSGYQAPFDRHDWEVVRPTEERMRYVIDFYTGKGSNSMVNSSTQDANSPRSVASNLSFHLDVRPAIDNWEGLRMRILRSWDELSRSFFSTSPTRTPDPPSPSQSKQAQ